MNQKTANFLQRVFDAYQTNIVSFKGDCHDCGKKVEIEIEADLDGRTEIRGGALYPVTSTNNDLMIFFKCQDCFDKHPRLENYQECEVYSRVVGFLRPVKSWNKGKQSEFKKRKMFDMEGYVKAEPREGDSI